ncbi:MAG: HEPN domain-containing protein [Spirochaetota bacterium]
MTLCYKNYRKKLNGAYDKNRIDRYKKYSKLLKEEGYVKPKTILEVSLQKLLLEKLDSLKANEIPTFLEELFHFQIDQTTKDNFQNIRQNRNSIAHGDKKFTPTLNDVIKTNQQLKKLSTEIENYINANLIPLNNYQE